ncbi:aldehyde dehydrogenase family protein [Aquirufa lenticrescens]|uniref:aldehyde dehydrogenase family protein n=1 Tax=Aquirufa lenticrescens TaxID=2696560 RepID=UPI001CAA47DE|nr:aldehyde dehydrogenase family protein [Aquirufa lenticrescens]UAJ14917.1 aldehyde dehydrogenase family protein [Aquirufa lenticrescens]
MENQILDVLNLQKSALLRLSTSSAAQRIEKLRKIESYLMQHKEDLCDALYADFKKPASEVVIAEMLGVKREINHTIKHLKSWMKPQSVSTPLMLLGTKGLVQYEAKGLCLIISPWNYPFNLSICPLVHAIAAGNAVILKPSELSPATAAFIQKMISSLFDKSEVSVFEGDATVSTFLLDQKFDHIFFTGSPAIGKVVMSAAAKHLTSVTLELGGKSPAIVGPEVNVEEAAAKIAWGKFLNNGQTCIAPDYLYLHEKNYFSFLKALEATVETFYGKNVAKSKDYARIVNRRHFDRIVSLLDDAKEKGAQVLFGGKTDADDCFIEPTVLINCTPEMRIMQEEIFGPILPVMSYQDEMEVTANIRQGDKPLALYVFSTNTEFNQYILDHTSSGTSVVNDCLIQFGHNELPFGGVNHSGIGKSGGHYGFVEFSNQKSVVIQRTNLLKNFYPPYGVKVRWMIDFVLKWL